MKYRIMVEGEDGMEFCFENNVNDSVGTHHGTNVNGEFNSSSVLVGSYDLDLTTSSYVQLPIIEPGSEFTICGWYRQIDK